MTDDIPARDHGDIDRLLPWFVNGTLAPAEHDLVARHLDTCADCSDNVTFLKSVQSAVVHNKATPIVPQPRVEQLLPELGPATAGRASRRYVSRRIAAVLAIVLPAAAALLWFGNPGEESPRLFETATSVAEAPAMDYVLRIQFEPGTSQVERVRVLKNIAARDVSGGVGENAYRAIVQLPATSLEGLERYTSQLEGMTEIRSVEVVALQLPVRPPQ